MAALKPAEEGSGAVLRLYDAHGAAGRARIEALPDGWSLVGRVDLLERTVGSDAQDAPDEGTLWHGSYEVVSLALRRD
ncbi:MAG: hypothetical protein U5J97_01765 [Trueperaceae bacterium]|nr:hypothetical protein [Trueperaceae bacterium]